MEKAATAGGQHLQNLIMKSTTTILDCPLSPFMSLLKQVGIYKWFFFSCCFFLVCDLPKIWTARTQTEYMTPSGQIGHSDGRQTAKCQNLKINTPGELVQVWRPWWRRGFADSEWWMMMMTDAVSVWFKSCHHFALKPLAEFCYCDKIKFWNFWLIVFLLLCLFAQTFPGVVDPAHLAELLEGKRSTRTVFFTSCSSLLCYEAHQDHDL